MMRTLRRSSLGTIYLLAMCIPATACGGPPDIPTTPDPVFLAHSQEQAPGMDEEAAAPIVLQPGDIVTVQSVSAETTSYPGLVVDERGMLHVPLAGAIEVGGMPLEAAQAKVEQGIRRFDSVARVNILLTTPTGQAATVLGAVMSPGRVPVAPGTRLADLLALAGGPFRSVEGGEALGFADVWRARLVRNKRVLPVNLAKAMEGDARHNVRVRAGDLLYVPDARGSRIAVLGSVGAPGVVSYRPGIRLTEVLAIGGAITIDGDRHDIRVVRGPIEDQRVYEADLAQITDGDRSDIVMAPGDVVYVSDNELADVGNFLARIGVVLSIAVTVGLAVWLTQDDGGP